jgi:hypothetical protein
MTEAIKSQSKFTPQSRSKGKASTEFIERITKHPNGWDLMKELSHRMA